MKSINPSLIENKTTEDLKENIRMMKTDDELTENIENIRENNGIAQN